MDMVVFQQLFSTEKEFIVKFIKKEKQKDGKQINKEVKNQRPQILNETLKEISNEADKYFLEIGNLDLNINSMNKLLDGF